MYRYGILAVIVTAIVLPSTVLAKKEPTWFIANVEENHCYELSSVSEYGQPVTTPDEAIAILRAEDSRLVTNVERPGLNVVVTLSNGEEIFFIPRWDLCKNHLAKIDMERRRQERKEAEERAAKGVDDRFAETDTWYIGYGVETELTIEDPEYGLPTTTRVNRPIPGTSSGLREVYVKQAVVCKPLEEKYEPSSLSPEEFEVNYEAKFGRPVHILRFEDSKLFVVVLYQHDPRTIFKYFAYKSEELCKAIVEKNYNYSTGQIWFGFGNPVTTRENRLAEEMEKNSEYFLTEKSRSDTRW